MVILLTVAVAGFLMVIGTADRPAYPQPLDGTFLPFVAQSVESWHPVSLLLLGLLGFVAGRVFVVTAPSTPRSTALFAILCGLFSVIGFFAWSVTDMLIGASGGHNLWPIEWLVYLGFGIPALVGAAIGVRSTWSTT